MIMDRDSDSYRAGDGHRGSATGDMRILRSTVGDAAYRIGDPAGDEADAVIRAGDVVRESVDGSGEYHVRVHAYTDPSAGTARWAVVVDGPVTLEIVDFGTRPAAEEFYERSVRTVVADRDAPFSTTDVAP